MHKDMVRRFGGSWVRITDKRCCCDQGYLRALDGDFVVLTNRWDGLKNKLPGKSAISIFKIVSIENIEPVRE